MLLAGGNYFRPSPWIRPCHKCLCESRAKQHSDKQMLSHFSHFLFSCHFFQIHLSSHCFKLTWKSLISQHCMRSKLFWHTFFLKVATLISALFSSFLLRKIGGSRVPNTLQLQSCKMRLFKVHLQHCVSLEKQGSWKVLKSWKTILNSQKKAFNVH